jgi:predicted ATPase/transcriptional regulator with XRE-family HTH domain
MGGDSATSATFGELLRDHRRSAGYSQEALAERAGLSAGAVSALEQGLRRAPYRDTVEALVKALNLAGSALMEFESSAAAARRRHRVTEVNQSGTIPVRLTSFVGRETDTAELKALLSQHRLTTITGSGGVGKTRIATEIATQFVSNDSGEASFVDLAPVGRGEHVAGAIASVLGNNLEGLLILDNCEHVVDEVAAAALTILRTCPGITILATSRERLAIEGEYVYRLSSLSAEKALELFEERAHASDVHVTFTSQEREMGAQICRHVEGIPLAIELAATRVPALGLEVLNARLRDYVTIRGGRDLPKRQQTINATISWSYDLLRAAEQMLLRRLSIFRGAFTLDAAETVCTTSELPSDQIATHLSLLVDKSLVEVQTASGTDRRYRLLDSVRTFSSQKLAEAGESFAIARAHAKRLADIADGAFELYAVGPRHVWFGRFAPELDEARAAVEWALSAGDTDDIVLAGRIVGGLRALWIDARILLPEGWWLAERVLARLDEEAFPSIAAPLLRLLIQSATDRVSLVAAIERARPIFERLNDTRALIGTQVQLADLFSRGGEMQEADDAHLRAFALAGEEHLEQSSIYLLLLGKRGAHHLRCGRLSEARADFAERRRRRTLLGVTEHHEDDPWEATIAFQAGFPEEAIALLEQSIAAGREAGASFYYSWQLSDMAAVYLTLGENERAASLARTDLLSKPFSILESMLGSSFRSAPEMFLPIQHLATVAARSAQLETAAKLFGFTNARFAAANILRFGFDKAGYDLLMASLHEQLMPEEIERYAEEGAQLDLRQAVDLALSISF